MWQSRKDNQLKRVKLVADIVQKHFEAGNQSKSVRQIYKQYIYPVYLIGERTFWRYLNIAKKEMGYVFDNNYDQYDIIFEKLLPETKELIHKLANIVLKIGTTGKLKKDVYIDNQDFILSQVPVSYPSFLKYLIIAEVYMGYQFDFKTNDTTRVKRESQKTNYTQLINS